MSATRTDVVSRNQYAAGQGDRRPWGDWVVLDAGPGYAVKRIRVLPGGILSLQRHQHRAEQWTVVAGAARVTRNTDTIDLVAGESIGIALGDIHRIANPGREDMVFIEVQTGVDLREDDIERLEDSYGRA
jgi:mannose-1-phosphate guanylyltransferase/mannose-6-phosphate isomerase